jgi:hypothetical protein
MVFYPKEGKKAMSLRFTVAATPLWPAGRCRIVIARFGVFFAFFDGTTEQLLLIVGSVSAIHGRSTFWIGDTIVLVGFGVA